MSAKPEIITRENYCPQDYLGYTLKGKILLWTLISAYWKLYQETKNFGVLVDIPERLKICHKEHVYDGSCWCNPTLYYTLADGAEIIAHSCACMRPPPPEVLATAIVEASFDEDSNIGASEN
jgi:hypothetical protein